MPYTPQASTTPTTGTLSSKVLVDQAMALQANLLPLMLGNFCISTIVAWMFRAGPHPGMLALWYGAQVVNTGFNLWAAAHLRRRPATLRNAHRRTRAGAQASLVSGALWGLGTVVFWPANQFELQVLLLFMLTGLTATALHALNAYLPAYRGFLLPCVLGVMVAAIQHGGLLNGFVALTVAIYGATSWHFAGAMNRILLESLRRSYEIQELAADLQLQRDRAQEASLSKSRFLAAASHDLRQPVHSLSLFVGALEHQPMGAEARRLLAHMSGCVGALGGMFNALLDMSKLDAGMVQPDLQALPLHDLLRQVCAEEQAQAQPKGLQLRQHILPMVVRSDTVLLDRILRNLVRNAVRYTDRGGVLVALQRRGGMALVSVVDSGIGIPADSHELVFQEFVQLHNPQRDNAEGLGLGLAIVRRLCRLLDIALTLRSQPGRGTRFTLRIPLAPERTVAAEALPSPAGGAPEITAPDGALVLVIDDDEAVRSAMQALLSGWGYGVLVASGFADMLPSLHHVKAVPALVLCDYRLRDHESGLHVVEQIAEQFNETIPAILITGDTAPERLQEAHASGLTLLHKPVSPEALRTAIRRALGASPPAP